MILQKRKKHKLKSQKIFKNSRIASFMATTVSSFVGHLEIFVNVSWLFVSISGD